MKVKRNLPRERPQLLERWVLPLHPPTLTCSCTSWGCLLRQTDFLFTGDDVKLLYTPALLCHFCSFSLPNPSVAWEERQKKGVYSLWRVLQISGFRGAVPVEEALPDLRGGGQWSAAFSSFGCNPRWELGLLPPIPSRAGLGPNSNHLILVCFAG